MVRRFVSVLHASDFHLRSVGDERWEALESVVALAANLEVSALTIGGDLFDRNVDAERLRSDLRSILSGNPFRVVVVPGNHDEGAFRTGLHFGEDVSLITDLEEPVVLPDEKLRFWGLPYEDLEADEVFESIQSIGDALDESGEWLDALLYHGQLVHPDYRNEGFGEEGSGKYMPLRLNFLEGTGLDYVLAGHYHSNARSHPYDGGVFLYPGSACPVTRSETGPRQCFLVDGSNYERRELSVPYYESLTVTLRPDDPSSPRKHVRERLDALGERARPLLTVEGFFNGDRLGLTETELADALREQLPGDAAAGDFEFRARDVRGIVGSELYEEFERRLGERSNDSDPDEEIVREMVLEAMMRAGLSREAD